MESCACNRMQLDLVETNKYLVRSIVVVVRFVFVSALLLYYGLLTHCLHRLNQDIFQLLLFAIERLHQWHPCSAGRYGYQS